MGRHSHEDAAGGRDWDDPLPVAQPGRASSVGTAALLTSLAEQAGPLGSLADLDAVHGIGPAMTERLDRLVSW